MGVLQLIHNKFVKARSSDEDTARKEFIFNILIIGFMALTLVAFMISMYRYVVEARVPEHVSPIVPGMMLCVVALLYCFARINFQKIYVVIFLCLYLFIGTFSLYSFGYLLSQGLLIYALVVVASGILVSSRASFMFTLMIMFFLIALFTLQSNSILNPSAMHEEGLSFADFIVYIVVFWIIFLISWLSSREIKHSLNRAYQSENLLKNERDLLEFKVQERTEQLQQAEAEKTIELYRFAEYGILSSSLMHDLASPLMSVSINFNELADISQKSELMDQIQEGIKSMESYVQSARRQLQKSSNIKKINVSQEIKKVISLNQKRMDGLNISCIANLRGSSIIDGDSIRFNQMVANLLTNAIDSLQDSKKSKKIIKVISRKDVKGLIQISITDNGNGIPDDKINTIFKPFYTTKEAGRGTGIGLSIVDRICTEFNAKLEVESNQKSTSFKIYLPISKAKE